jgi:hypothetical protein
MAKRLTIQPCDLAEANAFVVAHHRHHGPVVGHKFSIAAAVDGERVCGVVIVGRPVSRRLNDGLTLEVTRCCTDGTKDAASALYGAARRATFALGFRRLVTYTLATEPGTTLVAAGWKNMGLAGGGSWSVKSRPRVDKHPTQRKLRWEAAL